MLKVDGLLIGLDAKKKLFYDLSHSYEIPGVILSSLTMGSERWKGCFPQWMCRGIF